MTSALLKSINLKQDSKEQFNKREQCWCLVRERWVTEYEIPLSLITQDEISQNRETDSPPGQVSQMSNDLETVGIEKGICVEELKNGTYVVRWGNTRFRAGVLLESKNSTIKNCQKGHIYASIYDEPPSNLSILQAKENNDHKTSTPANQMDNIRSLEDIIASGHLDQDGVKYMDASDEEKKKRVREAVNKWMKKSAGKNFKSFWNKFRKKTESSFKVHSYDNPTMHKYFIKNNPFGINSMQEALKENHKYVFEVERDIDGNPCQKMKIYISFANGTVVAGSTVQSCWQAKYVLNNCEKAYVIVAVKVASSDSLPKTRENDSRRPEKWNLSVQPEPPKDERQATLLTNTSKKFIDGVFYLPQTREEKDSVNKWARIEKY